MTATVPNVHVQSRWSQLPTSRMQSVSRWRPLANDTEPTANNNKNTSTSRTLEAADSRRSMVFRPICPDIETTAVSPRGTESRRLLMESSLSPRQFHTFATQKQPDGTVGDFKISVVPSSVARRRESASVTSSVGTTMINRSSTKPSSHCHWQPQEILVNNRNVLRPSPTSAFSPPTKKSTTTHELTEAVNSGSKLSDQQSHDPLDRSHDLSIRQRCGAVRRIVQSYNGKHEQQLVPDSTVTFQNLSTTLVSVSPIKSGRTPETPQTSATSRMASFERPSTVHLAGVSPSKFEPYSSPVDQLRRPYETVGNGRLQQDNCVISNGRSFYKSLDNFSRLDQLKMLSYAEPETYERTLLPAEGTPSSLQNVRPKSVSIQHIPPTSVNMSAGQVSQTNMFSYNGLPLFKTTRIIDFPIAKWSSAVKPTQALARTVTVKSGLGHGPPGDTTIMNRSETATSNRMATGRNDMKFCNIETHPSTLVKSQESSTRRILEWLYSSQTDNSKSLEHSGVGKKNEPNIIKATKHHSEGFNQTGSTSTCQPHEIVPVELKLSPAVPPTTKISELKVNVENNNQPVDRQSSTLSRSSVKLSCEHVENGQQTNSTSVCKAVVSPPMSHRLHVSERLKSPAGGTLVEVRKMNQSGESRVQLSAQTSPTCQALIDIVRHSHMLAFPSSPPATSPQHISASRPFLDPDCDGRNFSPSRVLTVTPDITHLMLSHQGQKNGQEVQRCSPIEPPTVLRSNVYHVSPTYSLSTTTAGIVASSSPVTDRQETVHLPAFLPSNTLKQCQTSFSSPSRSLDSPSTQQTPVDLIPSPTASDKVLPIKFQIHCTSPIQRQLHLNQTVSNKLSPLPINISHYNSTSFRQSPLLVTSPLRSPALLLPVVTSPKPVESLIELDVVNDCLNTEAESNGFVTSALDSAIARLTSGLQQNTTSNVTSVQSVTSQPQLMTLETVRDDVTRRRSVDRALSSSSVSNLSSDTHTCAAVETTVTSHPVDNATSSSTAAANSNLVSEELKTVHRRRVQQLAKDDSFNQPDSPSSRTTLPLPRESIILRNRQWKRQQQRRLSQQQQQQQQQQQALDMSSSSSSIESGDSTSDSEDAYELTTRRTSRRHGRYRPIHTTGPQT